MTMYVNGRFLTQPMTGVQRFAYEVTSALVERRDDVSILTPQEGVLQDYGVPEHLITRVGSRSGHPWEQVDLPRFLGSRGRPPLVNFTSTAPMSYRNQIVTHHDITYVRYPQSYNWKFRTLYRAIIPRMLRSAKAVITVSEFSKREIHDHYRIPLDKLHVVYNAPAARFRPAAAPGDQPVYLLGVSSPNLHKNFRRLEAAYATLPEETRPGLLIVGSQARSFSKTDEHRQTPQGLRYLGRVSDEELVELYQGARAFVFPSLFEGFGLPPIEAQASGCPVLASDIPVLREVLGDSALYFDPLDESSIARAMQLVVDEPHRRADIVEAGRANAERFSWDRSAHTVSELVDQLPVA